MAVTVYIPTPFRRATGNRDRIDVSAAGRVGALLDELERAYGGLKGLVRNEPGEVHQHVDLYVNSEPIDGLDGLAHRAQGRRRGGDHPGARGWPVGPHGPDHGRAEAIQSQAVEEYPFESCGVILARGRSSGKLLRCRNAQNELHARDPVRYPRTPAPRTTSTPRICCASAISSARASTCGVIYHSHIDAGAYFSETDRRQARGRRRARVPGRRLRRHLGGPRAGRRDRRRSAGTPAAATSWPWSFPHERVPRACSTPPGA